MIIQSTHDFIHVWLQTLCWIMPKLSLQTSGLAHPSTVFSAHANTCVKSPGNSGIAEQILVPQSRSVSVQTDLQMLMKNLREPFCATQQ